MRILVTGASGFVATHLVADLKGSDHEVVLTCIVQPTNRHGYPFHLCDITDRTAVDRLIATVTPDAIVHLAGISNVVEADRTPARLMDINVIGTNNLCQAAAGGSRSVTFLFASSALVYGQLEAGDCSFSESSIPNPANPYGYSKLAAEYMTRSYRSDRFRPYIVRPFNHIGPGQHPSFVCPSLARRIVAAPDGSSVAVGNLDSYRDFTDVRDVVKAYRKIIEMRPHRDLFVLGSGRGVQIREIFDKLVAISGKRITPQVDKELLRQHDPVKIVADCSLARQLLGWEPQTPLEQTLMDIYRSVG